MSHLLTSLIHLFSSFNIIIDLHIRKGEVIRIKLYGNFQFYNRSSLQNIFFSNICALSSFQFYNRSSSTPLVQAYTGAQITFQFYNRSSWKNIFYIARCWESAFNSIIDLPGFGVMEGEFRSKLAFNSIIDLHIYEGPSSCYARNELSIL